MRQTQGFTKYPNIILDQIMNQISPPEFKILSFLIRCTEGFHKESDIISISQFEEATGLSRNTVLKAIRTLLEDNYITRAKAGNSFLYSIKYHSRASAKNTLPSSSSEPRPVQDVNQKTVQVLNTQKKPKENEKNSSTIISFTKSLEPLYLITYWCEVFDIEITNLSDKLKSDIVQSLNRYGLENLKRAILFRSEASFYKDKPYRSTPSAFFGYSETIQNDLIRKPSSFLSYDQMIDEVTTNPRLTTDHFEKVKDVINEDGNPYWRLKRF